MKTQIEKDKLLHLLTPAQSLVEKRNVIPILSKALVRVDKNELKIFVTDQENSLQCSCQVQKSKEGSACVDVQNFFSIVKELPEGPVSLEQTEKQPHLKIRTKTASFNIVGVQPEEFPIFPSLKEPQFFPIKTTQLSALIDQTSYCVSTDETRYHLNGVLCEKRAGGVRFTATDGHRLSYAEQPLKGGGFKIPEGVIIPRKGLQEITRLLVDEDEAQMAVEPPRALFQCGNFLLSVRLIEGKYPNYQQLIPKTSKIKITIQRELLSQALRRVSILSSQQSKNVHFQWEKEQLILTAKHPDLGDAKEEVPLVKGAGGSLAIRFNARYALEALSHIKDGEVIWEMNSSVSPGLIRSKSSNGVCVIMPMKL